MQHARDQRWHARGGQPYAASADGHGGQGQALEEGNRAQSSISAGIAGSATAHVEGGRCLVSRRRKPQVAAGMCYGATDLPAEAAAFEQQLEACLAMPRPALLLSSPLIRCAHLAQALGRSAWPSPVIHEGLAEMNFGQWEMKPWKSIARPEVEAWIADVGRVAPPGGESVEQVGQRASRSLADVLLPLLAQPGHQEVLLKRGGVVAVICHFGVIQSLSHAVTQAPWSGFKSFNLGYGEHLDVDAPLAWLQQVPLLHP